MEGKKSLLRVVRMPSGRGTGRRINQMHLILTGPPPPLRRRRRYVRTAFLYMYRRPGRGRRRRSCQLEPIWHVGARGPLPYAIFLLKKRKYYVVKVQIQGFHYFFSTTVFCFKHCKQKLTWMMIIEVIGLSNPDWDGSWLLYAQGQVNSNSLSQL